MECTMRPQTCARLEDFITAVVAATRNLAQQGNESTRILRYQAWQYQGARYSGPVGADAQASNAVAIRTTLLHLAKGGGHCVIETTHNDQPFKVMWERLDEDDSDPQT